MSGRPPEAPAGEAYAARSSRRIASRLRAAADGGAVELVDRDGGTVLASAPAAAIRRERRLGSLPKVGPNAFALPGGTIVVTDQLVSAFPEADVIAGVLGHEIAHVAEAHGLRHVYRSLGTYLLVAAIVGDVGPVLDDTLLEGGLLLTLSRSREHEREADRIGVAIAARAGYDPAALVRFFERLSADDTDGGPSWLSTHPSTGERVLRIRRLAEEMERSGG